MIRRDLAALANQPFDLLVIGGGITGACIAHDASLRGLSVALIERADFGAATSAASSKILHGGIRYLQQLGLRKLRESAVERVHFQRIAPHLTRYVPFLVPSYHGLMTGRLALWAAIRAYDLLTVGQNAGLTDRSRRVPPGRTYSREETLRIAPALAAQRTLTGACLIHEVHMHSSERMTLAFLKSAAMVGAVVANYVEAETLLQQGGRAAGVRALDVLTGVPLDIRARLVVNAAGPWIPLLNRTFGVSTLRRTVAGYSKGIHIVTRAITGEVALALPTAKRQASVVDRGGRHLFMIPWRGRSLIGTSNVPFDGAPGEIRATSRDVADFLDDVNASLPGLHLRDTDVHHAYAGLYPLTAATVQPEVYQGTGEYQVVDHEYHGEQAGLVSVLGAKYTTARRVAEQATDLVCRRLGRTGIPCRTTDTPLAGGAIDDLPAFLAALEERLRDRLDRETVQYLAAHYGTQAEAVLASSAPGVTPEARLSARRESVEAEVVFAVTQEAALHLDDVIFRRTGLGTIGHPGTACLERVAAIMAGLLGWTRQGIAAEVARVEALFTRPPF